MDTVSSITGDADNFWQYLNQNYYLKNNPDYDFEKLASWATKVKIAARDSSLRGGIRSYLRFTSFVLL